MWFCEVNQTMIPLVKVSVAGRALRRTTSVWMPDAPTCKLRTRLMSVGALNGASSNVVK